VREQSIFQPHAAQFAAQGCRPLADALHGGLYRAANPADDVNCGFSRIHTLNELLQVSTTCPWRTDHRLLAAIRTGKEYSWNSMVSSPIMILFQMPASGGRFRHLVSPDASAIAQMVAGVLGPALYSASFQAAKIAVMISRTRGG
jgi:hypothetical protein